MQIKFNVDILIFNELFTKMKGKILFQKQNFIYANPKLYQTKFQYETLTGTNNEITFIQMHTNVSNANEMNTAKIK